MNNPEITIVIPTYNRENIVLETLESVKLQTFENWECIIVDDYSTDNTISVINNYIKDDKRFKIIEKTTEKKGASAARNIGWRIAKSEYIIFLDSDDLLAPWAIMERLSFYKSNLKFSFVLSTAVNFSKTSNKLQYRSDFLSKDLLQSFLDFNATWQTSCPTWKKDTLEKINGWNENAMSWQDGEIHIRALDEGAKTEWRSYIPDVFIRVDTEKSITKTASVEKIKNQFEIYFIILEQIKNQEYRSLFLKNIEIRLYNIIEQVNKEKATEIIASLKEEDNNINYNKLYTYVLFYHSTKNLPLIKGAFYKLREKTRIYPKRKSFFISKNYLKDNNKKVVVNKINNYSPFTKYTVFKNLTI